MIGMVALYLGGIGDLSQPLAPNAIEKVLTGSAFRPAIIATTLGTTPPERKAPSGRRSSIRLRSGARISPPRSLPRRRGAVDSNPSTNGSDFLRHAEQEERRRRELAHTQIDRSRTGI
jgi:hypothetical protein